MHQLIGKKDKIIIYLLLLLILSTTSGKFKENEYTYSPIVNQIYIKGLSSANNSKISNELDNLLYKNILLIRKEEIKKVISKYNIIEEYTVKKIYPSTIYISIIPSKFVARLSGSDQLVGANGKLVDDRKYRKVLPYIYGKFNSHDFLNFKKDITQSKFIFTKFKILYFFPSNRWDILTNDDILIKLPQDNFSESLNLAYKIINGNNFEDISLIDLRIKNHLITK